MTELRPETRALIAHIDANIDSQNTPEFMRIKESLLWIQACTSLSDEDATARINIIPAGTTYGWQLTEDPDGAPVPCEDKPDTHRHLIFECCRSRVIMTDGRNGGGRKPRRKPDVDERMHEQIIKAVRSRVERLPGQRVSHVDLIAATELLTRAAEAERLAGNAYRASEINHLVIATFKAAIRDEDIVPERDPQATS